MGMRTLTEKNDALALYVAFAARQKKDGGCFLAEPQADTGLTGLKLRKALRSLLNSGLIEKCNLQPQMKGIWYQSLAVDQVSLKALLH